MSAKVCTACGSEFWAPATTGGRPRSRCDNCRSARARGGYDGTRWRKLRATVLAEEQCCYLCGGIATEVDHVVPLSVAPDRAYDRTNLRAICGPCNRRKGDRVTPAVNGAAGGTQPRPGWCVTSCDCLRFAKVSGVHPLPLPHPRRMVL